MMIFPNSAPGGASSFGAGADPLGLGASLPALGPTSALGPMSPFAEAMSLLQQAVGEFQALMQAATGASGMGSPFPGAGSAGPAGPAAGMGSANTPQQALAQFQDQSNQMRQVDKAVSDQVVSNNLTESLAKHLTEMGHI